MLDDNAPLYAVLKPREKNKTKCTFSSEKKGNKNRHVNNILFSSKNELAIRHTIQLHRYIFSIPHIQSAKKKGSNDYKAEQRCCHIYREMYVQWL